MVELNIIYEKENPLFSRKEVRLEVETSSVPSKEEAVKIVSEKYKVEPGVIRIRDVKGKYGVSLFSITADIYSSMEEFNRIVKKTKQEIEAEKKAIEEAKKAEEEAKATAEAEKKAAEEAKKAEEKPVEEKAEEKKKKSEEKPVEEKAEKETKKAEEKPAEEKKE